MSGDPRDATTPPAADEIAPSPVVEIAFDVDAAGEEFAIVEGVDVVPRDDEDARDAAIRTVAGMVDTVAGIDSYGNPYRYLRARIVGDSRHRSVVIHRDGRLFVSMDYGMRHDRTHDNEHGGASSHGGAPGTPPDEAGTRPHNEPQGEPQNEARNEPDEPFEKRIGEAAGVLLGRRPPEPDETAQDAVGTDGACDTDSQTEPGDVSDESDESGDESGDVSIGAGESRHDSSPTPDVPPATGPRALLRGPTAASRTRRRSKARKTTESPARSQAQTPTQSQAQTPADPRADRAARRQRLIEQARRSAERSHRGPRLRLSRSVLLIAAAAVIVVFSLVLVAVSLSRGGDGRSGEAAASVPPVNPPPGWAREAAWSTGPLAVEAGGTVGLDDAVGYVTADREVVVADVATGEAKWRVDLPEGGIAGPLARTRLVSTDALALHVADRLLVWSVADGTPVAAADVPADAQVTYLGPAPLVGVGPSTVAVVGSEGLVEIAVPEGAYALAAREDGSVTAAAPAGWWHLRAGRAAGGARPWENPSADSRPADSLPTITGYAGGSIVVVYPAFRDRPPEVVVHTDRPGDVRASFRGPAVTPGSARGTWIASESGTWGVLGRTLVDIRGGSVSDLGDWQTSSVTADRAFGTVGDQSAVVGPGVSREVLPADAQVPETTMPGGALIRLRGPLTDEAGQVVLREGAEAGFVVPPAS